jgi:hypothetical protein
VSQTGIAGGDRDLALAHAVARDAVFVPVRLDARERRVALGRGDQVWTVSTDRASGPLIATT